MKSIFVLIIIGFSLCTFGMSGTLVSAFTTVQQISINGNADLVAQASEHSWSGSGTSSNPYIIANYSISNSNDYSVIIQNTDLYFVLEENQINNGVVGIYLHNVRHGILENNSISNTQKFGILFDDASNNTVQSNIIDHTTNGIGVLITNSNNNLFNNNTSEFNFAHGFFISQNATDNTFINNWAISNGNSNSGVGFYVVFTTGNSLIDNYAINNTISGILVENSANTFLQNNTEIGNGKILEGASYSKILLFLGIVVLLAIVAIVLAFVNKKFS